MTKQQSMPKWYNPERRARLVELFHENINRCLKGHERCRDPQHYERVESEAALRGVRKSLPIRCGCGCDAPVGVVEYGPWVTVPVRLVTKAVYENRYEAVEPEQIAEWVAHDRDDARHALLEEQARLHDLGEVQTFRHEVFTAGHVPFDPVAADLFYARRPEYYLKGVHADADFRRVAMVRVPSTTKVLSVPIPPLGKNARRKLARYGIEPKELSPQNHALVRVAVQAWRKRVGLD